MDHKRKQEDDVQFKEIHLSIEKRKELRNMTLKTDKRKRDHKLEQVLPVLCKFEVLTKEGKESLMLDLESVDLTNHLDEPVVPHILKAKSDAKSDMETVVEVCCLLHQQYPSFSGKLGRSFRDLFKYQKVDGVEVVEKLAFMLEYFLVGILDNDIFFEILEEGVALGRDLESDLYVLLTFATEAPVLLGLPCADKLEEEFFEGFQVDIELKIEYKMIFYQCYNSWLEKLNTEFAAQSCVKRRNTYDDLFEKLALLAKVLDISPSTTIDASSGVVESKHKTGPPLHPSVRSPSKQIPQFSQGFVLSQTLGKTFEKFYGVISREVPPERKHLTYVHNFISVPESKKVKQEEKFETKVVDELMPRLRLIMPGLSYSYAEDFITDQWEKHGRKQKELSPFVYFNHIINLFGTFNLDWTLGNLGMPIDPYSWQHVEAEHLREQISFSWKVSPTLSCINTREHLSSSWKVSPSLCSNDDRLYLFEAKLFTDKNLQPVDGVNSNGSSFEGCEGGDLISF